MILNNFFIRTAISNGVTSYHSTSSNNINQYSFKTFGFLLEVGIDQKFFENLFDFYIGTVFNMYMYEISDPSVKISGLEVPIYFGIRHSF